MLIIYTFHVQIAIQHQQNYVNFELWSAVACSRFGFRKLAYKTLSKQA
jgi:hypothetical protein